MKIWMRVAGAILVAVALPSLGCTSPSPWSGSWGQTSSLSTLFGKKSTPSGAVTQAGVPSTNPVKSATDSVNKAFKAAGESVAATLEPKPKVIPASDPSKLSSRPDHLSPAVYVQAAHLSESQGALPQVRQQYERALELDPNNIATLVALARFCDRQNQADEALRRYEQALKIAPTNTLVLNDLGLFHARHGNLDAALMMLNQAVRTDPNNVRYRNNLAATLIQANRVAEAIEVLRGVHPEAVALYNAACLLTMVNRPQPATGLLEQALRVDPALTAAREMLSRLRREGPFVQAAQPSGRMDQTPPTQTPPITSDPAIYETASRPTATVWESTSIYSRPYRLDKLDEARDLPHKLPPPE